MPPTWKNGSGVQKRSPRRSASRSAIRSPSATIARVAVDAALRVAPSCRTCRASARRRRRRRRSARAATVDGPSASARDELRRRATPTTTRHGLRRARLLEQRRVARLGDEDRHARVPRHVPELARLEARVDGHRDRAQAHRAELQREASERGVQQQPDAVALADARAVQPARGRVAPASARLARSDGALSGEDERVACPAGAARRLAAAPGSDASPSRRTLALTERSVDYDSAARADLWHRDHADTQLLPPLPRLLRDRRRRSRATASCGSRAIATTRVSQGYTCPKGRALGELHHHPQRLDGPLLRRNGRLEPVTWDELLDDLAAKRAADARRARPGRRRGVLRHRRDVRREPLLGRARRCSSALGSPAKFTSGDGRRAVVSRRAPPHGRRRLALPRHRLRARDADDPPRHEPRRLPHLPHAGVPEPDGAAPRARPRAARCGWSTPAATETARLATRHLAVRPGTDYALLGFLVRELLRDGADRAYLEAHATRRRRARRAPSSATTSPGPPRVTGLDAREPRRPPRGDPAPRPARPADGHRHLDVPGREPHPVALDRAPRRHGLARAPGRRLVQPRLRPGARQAPRAARPAAGARSAEPARAPPPGWRVPGDHDRRRARGGQPPGALRPRREPPRGAAGRPPRRRAPSRGPRSSRSRTSSTAT